MENFLEKIIAYKDQEAKKLEQIASPSIDKILKEGRPLKRRFEQALRAKGLSVIAEMKRRSPSAGLIDEIPSPAHLAKLYTEGGARAISVLTDGPSFGGSIEDLKEVCKASPLPILRKDFIVAPIQIAEAAVAGASAILIIVAVNQKETEKLLKEAERMGMEAVVEVATKQELEVALLAQARMIGVNNRDLKTFEVNTQKVFELKPLIPTEKVSIAASGIKDPEETKKLIEVGYDAVLIGQMLVEASDPKELIRKIRGFKK